MSRHQPAARGPGTPPPRVSGTPPLRLPSGQASLMMLAVVGVLLAGTLILFAFANALGAKGSHQRAADLAAVSAAQVMRELYPRLFEPPFLKPGVPNPRHLEQEQYLALAREAALRGAERNGVRIRFADVTFPDAGFAPTRVTVRVHARVRVGVGDPERGRRDSGHQRGRRDSRRPGRGPQRARPGRGRERGRGGEEAGAREHVPVEAQATAELSPGLGDGMPAIASGGGYDGPLAYRQGQPMRPDVALAFDRMAAAARKEAGLLLSVTSGFRSDAEQAVLFAAQPKPHLFSSL